MNPMQYPDVVIAGAGVTGLSLALELRRRGRKVLVLDGGTPGLASRAAAGMLAARDPHNPSALQPLADLAFQLYPEFLAEVRQRSGHAVPIQSEYILQADSAGAPGWSYLPPLAPSAGDFVLLPEQSLNPRDLHTALRAAAQADGVQIEERHSPVAGQVDSPAQQRVDCTGAWSAVHTRPAKGQMLRVQLPPGALGLAGRGNVSIRTGDFYIVPRLDGSALIGATVEDCGFDLTTQEEAIRGLRARAATLLPPVASAPEIERWAGLRPRTPDDLPILGRITGNEYVANGLFRNGILLAPAVAHVMAQTLLNQSAAVEIGAFSPERFFPGASR